MSDEELCQYIYNRTGINLNLNNGFIDLNGTKELFDNFNIYYEDGKLEIVSKNPE